MSVEEESPEPGRELQAQILIPNSLHSNSYMTGYEAGHIAGCFASGKIPNVNPVRGLNRPEIDLLAMRYGYSAEFAYFWTDEEFDEEWYTVEFARGGSNVS